VKTARLVLSDSAVADILEQADWYMAQSGQALVQRWEKAVTSAVLRVVENPAAGTPCAFQPAELRNVRRTAIVGFPKHLLFYRVHGTEILVLRVVHGARDLEKLF
jgi:toxin ParE1/3/4